jgi:hypothetical protein
MTGHFSVQVIHADGSRVETGQFDVEPTHEKAAQVCALFADFLRGQPPQFRAPLPFLKRTGIELEWAAAAEGAAFATFYTTGEPCGLAVMASGASEEADEGLLAGFQQGIVEPLMGPMDLDSKTRPLLRLFLPPGNPELAPTLQLLATALAAVYFRALSRKP